MLPVSSSWQADSALSGRTLLNVEVTGHVVPPKCCTAALAMDATEVAVALACRGIVNTCKSIFPLRRSLETLTLNDALCAVQCFHSNAGLRTCRFSELSSQPPRATEQWKNYDQGLRTCCFGG